ncbi:Gfo/Idh/MocA family oxidoreductase [bacterium]|nr:Gfo/Idh/MocA family oxidoreductase [bacterium]
MKTRRTFLKTAAAGGLAGIISAGKPPAFAQDSTKIKVGQLGLGSHGFVESFVKPPEKYRSIVRCRPYAVWDDVPEAAEALKRTYGFEKIIADPVQLVKESDVVHVEHADYRKVFELAQPALEAGKPVFINRPFTATIADAEEVIRLARAYDAPVMSASSLEFQPVVAEMQKFAGEKGPVRAYEAYCPEPHFTWMFPHVINYAHAALGGGIESAYFTGEYLMDMTRWIDEKRPPLDLGKWIGETKPIGSSLCVLTYKPREGQPPMIGMCHIGAHPGSYHIDVYAAQENRLFEADTATIFDHMFLTLHDFYVNRTVPRPYEAILEQHRALVAANVSRLTGRAVRLDSLGGGDSLPYSEAIRRWLLRNFMGMK